MPARVVRLVNTVGLELLAGLVVLTGAAWLFAALADELAEGDTRLDAQFANWIHGRATSGWTTFFENVTRLGNVSTLLVVVFLAGVVLWRTRRIADLQLLVLSGVGAEIITTGLKLGFQRERPFFADPLATEATYSFPSGHASVSLAVYGTLGYIAARHLATRARQVGALVAAVALVALIGFSRLYLGVHYLSDVVAGYSVGIAWVALCVVLLHLRLRLRSRSQTSRYRASA